MHRRRLVSALALLAAVAAGRAGAVDGVLVVAPHPDDEVLIAGGVIVRARAARRTVDVVVVTNGDWAGEAAGLVRERESVEGLAVLGVPEAAVRFLGYPDGGLLALWNAAPRVGQRFLSPRTGRTTTYATRGRGGADVHTVRTGVPGAYNRPTLVADLRAVLAEVRPADVYVTGAEDEHPDHRAVFYAVREAARAAAAADPSFRPVLHATLVHDPVGAPFDDFWPPTASRTPRFAGNDDAWPNPALADGVPLRFLPGVPFVMPPSLPRTVRAWAARRSLPVPAAMAAADVDANPKMQSLRRHASQARPGLFARVKADEFFWSERVRVGAFTRNVAGAARATASSSAPGSSPAAVQDGVVGRTAEWRAGHAGAAVLGLTWPVPVLVDRVVVHDAVGLDAHVTAGLIVLDGTPAVRFGPLANDGRGDAFVLPAPRRVRSLRVAVDQARGTPGLAEVEVFGEPPRLPCRDGGCDDGNPCTRDACVAGTCTGEPVADDTPCGDDDACNGVERCVAGACRRLPPPDCDDGDPCTADACVAPGTCGHHAACAPVRASGRGGCRVAFVGLPAAPCEDGDPACDRDEATDGGCRFDVVVCVDSDAPGAGCRAGAPVILVAARGRWAETIGPALAPLQARLPQAAPGCVGPTPIRLGLRGRGGRTSRARMPLAVVTADRRLARAAVRVACRPAPRGVRRGPVAPLVP
jgi:LmbE family N-acetylglucosaminyl deacetylase